MADVELLADDDDEAAAGTTNVENLETEDLGVAITDAGEEVLALVGVVVSFDGDDDEPDEDEPVGVGVAADVDVVARAPTVMVVKIGFASGVLVSCAIDAGTAMEDVATGSGLSNDPAMLFNLLSQK